jgi:hypothetical protein
MPEEGKVTFREALSNPENSKTSFSPTTGDDVNKKTSSEFTENCRGLNPFLNGPENPEPAEKSKNRMMYKEH